GPADCLDRLPALGLRRSAAHLQVHHDGGPKSQGVPRQRQSALRIAVKRQDVTRTIEVPPGHCKIVSVNGRDIGVFNLNGEYFALANRCPHEGGPLCQGKIIPLIPSDGPGHYKLGRHKEFLPCPWHGWEFEIRTGQSWCDPKSTRARQFQIKVE